MVGYRSLYCKLSQLLQIRSQRTGKKVMHCTGPKRISGEATSRIGISYISNLNSLHFINVRGYIGLVSACSDIPRPPACMFFFLQLPKVLPSPSYVPPSLFASSEIDDTIWPLSEKGSVRLALRADIAQTPPAAVAVSARGLVPTSPFATSRRLELTLSSDCFYLFTTEAAMFLVLKCEGTGEIVIMQTVAF